MNLFFSIFLPVVKKIKALYTTNWMILFWLSYTTFLIWPLFRGRNPGKNFVVFLGDLNTPKGHFKINWPIAPHISHLKSLFSLWTDAMYRFMKPFWEKLALQMLHLKGFFSSWTASMCSFLAKLAQHVSQLNGFFPSWTDATWLFKFTNCVKLVLQILHSKGFFP